MPCKTQVINDAQGQASPQRVMATVFWDLKGVLLIHFLHARRTVNASYFCELLEKVRAAYQLKKARFLHSRRAAASRQCQTPFRSPNPRKTGSDVLDCPRTSAIQPGPLPLRLTHV